ncbi:MAG: FAD-binding protein [Bacteroidetes bacterium]|nr:FAD-binding protein [Bacteroidota bacterium]MDA1122557.1 FAD-binding protein [Bacteroidota bacterium]
MKKRTFIKTSSILATGAMLSPLTNCESPKEQVKTSRYNWAGNYQFKAENFLDPGSNEEVQSLVKKTSKLKALGSRHSFNNIADNPDNQLSTYKLDKIIELDSASQTVTVEAGVSYGKLSLYLYENGFALHNLASLPHISVAGACATATHGSGDNNGNLATAVSALEMVTANGEIIKLSRDKDGGRFNGVVVGLGALGIVTKVTLDVQPTFDMTQDVYLNMPMNQMADHFDEIEAKGYSVSLFTDWQNNNINQVWLKNKVAGESQEPAATELFGALRADRDVHPIIELSAGNCTEQMSVPGPWYNRLPHFKMDFMPSSGKELQSEFFVPRHHAVEAILAINKLADLLGPHLFISEIRTVAADNLWMSTAYQRPSAIIHFTWKQDWEAVSKLLPIIERKLAPFDVRPHWGKLFTIDPKVLQSRYDRYDDFMKLVKEFDPQGKFRNAFLDKNIYG